MDHTMAENSYDASQIQVLEGLEPVRKRPGMYIGSTDVRGLHHLVYEIVDNSIDEAMGGFCDRITVTLQKDGGARVVDNGRGIPVGIQQQTGKSALEVALTMLHAGGKFGGEGYKVSGGLHGVGLSVVNALSQRLVATVCREGREFQMSFKRGEPEGDIRVTRDTDETGTAVQFWPDPEIFETVDFDYDTLKIRLRELAFLNRGLRICLIDERTGQKNDYCFEGGIVQFVKYLNKNKLTLHPSRSISWSKRIRPASRSRCSITTATMKTSIRTRTTSPRTRAART
jgi:DNA gyrase subunit B